MIVALVAFLVVVFIVTLPAMVFGWLCGALVRRAEKKRSKLAP